MGRPKKNYAETQTTETQTTETQTTETQTTETMYNVDGIDNIDGDTVGEGNDISISQTIQPTIGKCEVIKIAYPTIEEYLSHLEENEEQLDKFLFIVKEKYFKVGDSAPEPQKQQPKARAKTYEEMMGITTAQR